MKIDKDYLNNFVLLAHNSSSNNLHNLSQADRKLLVVACEVFKDKKSMTALEKKEGKLKKLEAKLQMPEAKRSYSNWLVSFFKFVFNNLNLRISYVDVMLKIQDAYREIVPMIIEKQEILRNKESLEKAGLNDLKDNYADCVTTFVTIREDLKKMRNANNQIIFNEEKLDHIKNTIDGYCKVAIYRTAIQEVFKQNWQYASPFMTEKTGLMMHHNNPVYLMLDSGPELLFNTFVEAKKNGRVVEFFKEAFATEMEDLCYEARYKRVAEFIEKESARANLDAAKLMPITCDVNKTKRANIGQMIETFQERQADEYIKHLKEIFENEKKAGTPADKSKIAKEYQEYLIKIEQKKVTDEDTKKIKQKILIDDEFDKNFRTSEKFKLFLLNDVKIEGQKCSDGPVAKEDLDEEIKYYVDLDMLV